MNIQKNLMITAASGALALGAIVASDTPARADIVHLDDVIIAFSLCVGNDCVNGESFGFDTIRLKENNLRIHFQDTSNSSSFPTNDWRIVINDSSNGGGNYFAVEDSNAGRQPFRVDAGAPANALRVDAQGDVGIGTSNPVVDLHVVSGNTPTLRLEQNGSSGFTPQTWDMAGNEANFFIRDVTNGSALSFRIKPGADQDSLFIAANNDVGMGTASPNTPLHVKRSTGATLGMATFENNSDAYLSLINSSGNTWNIANLGGEARIISPDGPGIEFRLTTAGALTITGPITTGGGTCGGGCDAVFEENYDLASIEEHADLMWKLKHLPNVGPTVENAPFNVSDKVGRMLNELEKAHIYIEQLHNQLADAKSDMVRFETDAMSDIARLEARMELLANQDEGTAN